LYHFGLFSSYVSAIQHRLGCWRIDAEALGSKRGFQQQFIPTGIIESECYMKCSMRYACKRSGGLMDRSSFHMLQVKFMAAFYALLSGSK
jgi:hypothetical protein